MLPPPPLGLLTKTTVFHSLSTVTPTPYGTFDPTKPIYASLSPELTGCKCVYHHSHIFYYDPYGPFFLHHLNHPTVPRDQISKELMYK